jgi:hypothetical protein
MGKCMFLGRECGILVCFGREFGVMSISRFRDPDPDDQRGRPQGVDGVRVCWLFWCALRVFLIGRMGVLGIF